MTSEDAFLSVILLWKRKIFQTSSSPAEIPHQQRTHLKGINPPIYRQFNVTFVPFKCFSSPLPCECRCVQVVTVCTSLGHCPHRWFSWKFPAEKVTFDSWSPKQLFSGQESFVTESNKACQSERPRFPWKMFGGLRLQAYKSMRRSFGEYWQRYLSRLQRSN